MFARRLSCPVIIKGIQLHPLIFHILHKLKRTGTDRCIAVIPHTLYINNAGIRITKTVRQSRVRFLRCDRQHISVRFHGRNAQLPVCTALHGTGTLQRCLYSLCIHRIAALKQDAVAQLKRPHQSVLRYGIVIHQIFLYVHAVIQLKQGFHHTDTHAHPGISAGCRIHIPHIIAKHKIPSCILFCPASDARTCRYQHT